MLRTIGGSPGRASHRMATEADRVVFEAREALARLLEISDATRLVLTRNATESINIALKGCLGSGEHLITTSFEHNSVARPAKRLEREGVNVTWLKGNSAGLIEPCEVEAAITPSTRLVCVTHASNVFGAILPAAEIGRICNERGVLFMLDASQTVGAVPLSMEALNADIVAGTGHKALFGPQGTGFLFLKEGVEPKPLIDGGTGEIEEQLDLPERLEAGTMNMPGIAGLGAGVKFLLSTGLEKIREHELLLGRMLIDGLSQIRGISILGPEDVSSRVSLVSFTMEGKDPRDVGITLDEEFSIMVRSGTHCAPEAHKRAGTFPHGAVRVSPGFFNTARDIEALLDAAEMISKR